MFGCAGIRLRLLRMGKTRLDWVNVRSIGGSIRGHDDVTKRTSIRLSLWTAGLVPRPVRGRAADRVAIDRRVRVSALRPRRALQLRQHADAVPARLRRDAQTGAPAAAAQERLAVPRTRQRPRRPRLPSHHQGTHGPAHRRSEDSGTPTRFLISS